MLWEGEIDKFAMGRSTGLQVRNWKTRWLTITQFNIGYADKKGADPKHEMSTQAISVVWENPSTKDHEKANSPTMVMIRVWTHGAFDLLINAKTPTNKTAIIEALKEATKSSRGVQWPGSSFQHPKPPLGASAPSQAPAATAATAASASAATAPVEDMTEMM